jgi:hypothetical protein
VRLRKFVEKSEFPAANRHPSHPSLVIDMPVGTCYGVVFIDDVRSELFQVLSDLTAILGVPDRDTNVTSAVGKMITYQSPIPSSMIDDFYESSRSVGFRGNRMRCDPTVHLGDMCC